MKKRKCVSSPKTENELQKLESSTNFLRVYLENKGMVKKVGGSYLQFARKSRILSWNVKVASDKRKNKVILSLIRS